MKALAIDSASSCMCIAAKNEDDVVTVSLDIGMRQSEKILPTINYVLTEAGLSANDLDYTVLTEGPGTFTGLRLSFAALKAITLAAGTPIYGVPSLDAYANPYKMYTGAVVSVIDAKKNQFFASVYRAGKTCVEASDTTPQKIAEQLNKNEKVLITGPDAAVFRSALLAISPDLTVECYNTVPAATHDLFEIAEKMISNKDEPLRDFDGPVYLRKSEAELSLSAAK